MVTIFTTAKPFIGQTKIRQINAIKSWKALSPDVEVILFGDGEGYVEVAKELNITLIQEVQTSEQGTPLVNSLFSLARKLGHSETQIYVNCDIILICQLEKILATIKKDKFLVVGQRWDIDFSEEIRFESPDWQEYLCRRVKNDGQLHPPTGSDYFLYRGDIWEKIPKLVVGRAGYDNYLIYYCRLARIPVIDATEVILAVHQNHDYGHHPLGIDGVFSGPEYDLNCQMVDKSFFFTIMEADWQFRDDRLHRNYARGNIERYFLSLRSLYRENWLCSRILGLCYRIFRLKQRNRS